MKRRELIKMAGAGAAVAALARPAVAQSISELASVYSGYWTFRVFEPMYEISDQSPPNELALIRAEAVMNFQTSPPRVEWDDGRSGLVLNPVTVKPGVVGEPASFYSVGTPDPPGWQPLSFYSVGSGPPNTDTAGWQYDYYGHLARNWPNTNPDVQRPLLVGSVLRAKSHNGAPPRSPAGEVFSFIAVKHQPPFIRELSGVWTYRSFLNDPRPLYPRARPPVPELILREALLKLEAPTSTTLQGRIEWLIAGGGDSFFDLRGWMQPGVGDETSSFGMVGTRQGFENEEYYEGHLTRNWSSGINQIPALVGSLIRGKPNPESPARSVPFIAVKQQ
jgi:hypothetical protein